jgi:hypothetical protein
MDKIIPVESGKLIVFNNKMHLSSIIQAVKTSEIVHRRILPDQVEALRQALMIKLLFGVIILPVHPSQPYCCS